MYQNLETILYNYWLAKTSWPGQSSPLLLVKIKRALLNLEPGPLKCGIYLLQFVDMPDWTEILASLFFCDCLPGVFLSKPFWGDDACTSPSEYCAICQQGHVSAPWGYWSAVPVRWEVDWWHATHVRYDSEQDSATEEIQYGNIVLTPLPFGNDEDKHYYTGRCVPRGE